MRVHYSWALFWLFLAGAICGTALDAFHVYSSIERYHRPAFLGVAWWVPLLFGFATVSIGYSHPFMDPLIHNIRRPRRLTTSIAELSWLLLAYVIAAGTFTSISKAILLGLIYFNFWLLTGRGWRNLLLSVVTAITGTLIEMTLVAAGAFSYLQSDIFGIPYWLPFMYACASLAVGDLGRSLMYSTTRGGNL
jgi:hypothetical protein